MDTKAVFTALVDFSKVCISVPEVCFNLNSEDPVEMQHTAAFHKGLYCFPK